MFILMPMILIYVWDTLIQFLTLRLLNKRTRARLSEKPLDLGLFDGQGNYFVVSNTRGWFVAIVSGNSELPTLSSLVHIL